MKKNRSSELGSGRWAGPRPMTTIDRAADNSLPRPAPHSRNLLLAEGQHPKTVSEMLGHATITITLDTCSLHVPVLHQRAAGVMDELFGLGP